LLIFDLGFLSFLWFDDFTDQHKSFVTRRRQHTAYRTTHVLSHSPYYRDELIEVGLYRSNPCRHPLRLVSGLWRGQWYRYLTNVLAPPSSRHDKSVSCIDTGGALRTPSW